MAVRRDGEIAGGCQLLLKRAGRFGAIGYAPRGPLTADGDRALIAHVLDGLDALAQRARVRYLKAQPPRGQEWLVDSLTVRGFRASDLEAAPTATLVLDLGRDLEEIRGGLRSSTRRNIGRAERRGVAVRCGGEEDIETFARLVGMTAERLGFDVYPVDYYARMWREFQPDDSRMLIAEHEGEPVAATMIIAWGEWAAQKVGGWNGDKKVPFPNEVLRWTGICWAKERGYRWYDFEGIPVETAQALVEGRPRDEVAKGAAGFKLQFGGDAALFPPAYDRGYGVAALPVRVAAPRMERMRWLAHRVLGRGGE